MCIRDSLNSILMTSAGSIIIAGSIYVLGLNDQGPGSPRTPISALVPLVELDETPVVDEQVEVAAASQAPAPKTAPVLKEETVKAGEKVEPPTAFVASVQPVPPVRQIKMCIRDSLQPG